MSRTTTSTAPCRCWNSSSSSLGLGDGALPMFRDLNGAARLQNVGEWFLAEVVAVEHQGQLRFNGAAPGDRMRATISWSACTAGRWT